MKPVIIIGAGRSGTNMLRDVLTRLPGFDTWPCDEINYIWRHGNRSQPTDEFGVDLATPAVVDSIRGEFGKMASRNAGSDDTSTRFLVEKTCANSLRVDFVEKVVPEARFIYLIRDGRDVVSSARKRWKAPLDLSYIIAKARFVPKSDVAYYAVRYLANRVHKLFSRQSAVSVWGPRFAGMTELAKNHSVEYVCAAQWTRCVELSDAAFERMDSEKVFKLRYEDFVANPQSELQKIALFLGHDSAAGDIDAACQPVNAQSVGKSRSDEGFGQESSQILELMQDTLRRNGYV